MGWASFSTPKDLERTKKFGINHHKSGSANDSGKKRRKLDIRLSGNYIPKVENKDKTIINFKFAMA